MESGEESLNGKSNVSTGFERGRREGRQMKGIAHERDHPSECEGLKSRKSDEDGCWSEEIDHGRRGERPVANVVLEMDRAEVREEVGVEEFKERAVSTVERDLEGS